MHTAIVRQPGGPRMIPGGKCTTQMFFLLDSASHRFVKPTDNKVVGTRLNAAQLAVDTRRASALQYGQIASEDVRRTCLGQVLGMENQHA